MKTVNVKSLGECPYLISLDPNDLIGNGGYGKVYRGYNKNNQGQKLAIKILDINYGKNISIAFQELMVVMELPKHENLVSYKKVKITSKNRIYIIMQQCEKSLKSHIKQHQISFSQSEIWNFLIQFIQGYKILNKKQIIHRDIKLDNILIGYDGKYKISDFGLAEIVKEIKWDTKINGTLGYLAPELLDGNKECVSCLNDVYGLGVCCFEMCFGKLPYVKNVCNLNSIAKFITEVKYNSLVFPQNHTYSSQLINFISSMLQKSQSKRCSWQYIFYVVMQKSSTNTTNCNKLKINSLQVVKKFRIIQISDTLLKNLSNLDKDIYNSIQNKSLIIIDHIQAQIIYKRLIVYYCDRIQFRLSIINKKMNDNQLIKFIYLLLMYTYQQSKQLDECFEKYYQKIQKNQFMKIVTSYKYSYIKNLIKQDYLSLKNQLQQLRQYQQLQLLKQKQNNKRFIKSNGFNKMKELETQIYEQCFKIIIKLYENGFYQQCKQVDELEKWLENKDKNQSILSKIRKNQNILKQFNQSICGISKDQLKSVISQNYVYYFNQIDKKQ